MTKYIIPMLLVLAACGSAPTSSSSGSDGSSGAAGSVGPQGPKGDTGSSGAVVATTMSTCEGLNVTYRVGTQINLFYQEVTLSNNLKVVSCNLGYGSGTTSHEEYIANSDSRYAIGECLVRVDLNDLSGGYWKFTNDKKLLYIDSTSAVAGLNYDFSSMCH